METNSGRFHATVLFRGSRVELVPDEGTKVIDGDGLRLDFRDSQGRSISMFGVARRVGAKTTLDILHTTLDLDVALLGRIRPRVALEFRVRPRDRGVHLVLRGPMTEPCCLALGEELARAASRCPTPALPFFVDATLLKTSPEDVLPSFRHALARMQERRATLGVVFGPPSISMSQFMRLLRESGLADGVVFTNDEAEAATLWKMIHAELLVTPAYEFAEGAK